MSAHTRTVNVLSNAAECIDEAIEWIGLCDRRNKARIVTISRPLRDAREMIDMELETLGAAPVAVVSHLVP